MSSVNYNLKNRGVRLISSDEAWEAGKNGRYRLSPNYRFVGKVEMTMPNMVISVSDKTKPTYRGDVNALNRIAKQQIVDHFFDDDGKRNKKTVAYLVIEKKQKSSARKK